MKRGLTATAGYWPTIRWCYRWVHATAKILGQEGVPGAAIQARLRGLLGAMKRYQHRAGKLRAAVEHFRKVTGRYWRGLFACYDTPELPRTNNGLEQLFGSHRYHERRATGRKAASPALVLRGSARLLAALATRQRVFRAADLAHVDRHRWRELRQTLEERRQARVQRRRFRRDPVSYLRRLEEKLTQLTLPA